MIFVLYLELPIVLYLNFVWLFSTHFDSIRTVYQIWEKRTFKQAWKLGHGKLNLIIVVLYVRTDNFC